MLPVGILYDGNGRGLRRKSSQRKGREDYFSWMDDEELKESMRDFARRQGDSK